MTNDDAQRLLVFPDRDAAEDAVDVLTEHGAQPRLVREALAGEDDAEDAQWLVVLPCPDEGWPPARLAMLGEVAAAGGGWVEDTA